MVPTEHAHRQFGLLTSFDMDCSKMTLVVGKRESAIKRATSVPVRHQLREKIQYWII